MMAVGKVAREVQRLADAHASSPRRGSVSEDLIRLMRRHGRPIGAYDLMSLLAASRGKRPNIYKSLQSLAARGLVVRIASLRRYWAWPETLPTPAILLACHCGRVEVAESDAVRRSLASASFRAVSIEVPGQCRHCRVAAADHRPGGPTA